MKIALMAFHVLLFMHSCACVIAGSGRVSFEIVDRFTTRSGQEHEEIIVSVDVRVVVEGGGAIPAAGWSFAATVSPLSGAIGDVRFAPPEAPAGEPNLEPAASAAFFDFDRDFVGMSYGVLGATDRVIEATSTYVPPLFAAPPNLDANGNLELPSGAGLVRLPLSLSPDALGDFRITVSSDPHFNGVAYITPGSNIAFHPTGTHLTGILTVVESVGIAGDYDGNGEVGQSDYQLWTEQFGRAGTVAADGNGDGTVNAADYVVWRNNFTSSLPGDYDRDGDVDQADYLVWQQQFGMTGAVAADGNGDGTVNAADYVVWRNNLAQSASASSTTNDQTVVPEPGSILLLSLGIVVYWSLSIARASAVGNQLLNPASA